jgi:hypothetical protein
MLLISSYLLSWVQGFSFVRCMLLISSYAITGLGASFTRCMLLISSYLLSRVWGFHLRGVCYLLVATRYHGSGGFICAVYATY